MPQARPVFERSDPLQDAVYLISLAQQRVLETHPRWLCPCVQFSAPFSAGTLWSHSWHALPWTACERSHVNKLPWKYNSNTDDLGCLAAPLPPPHSFISPSVSTTRVPSQPSLLPCKTTSTPWGWTTPSVRPSTGLAPTCVSDYVPGRPRHLDVLQWPPM